ncbi:MULTISPECIES: hypothetical protein [unclassified Providencia]|uniref:hypothetical protein n=1 Tax=unclassified Providencia TaxID=2633465 RepID=UPI0023496696|nr:MULTISPECIES: hypothetical protein [unclassified Providencia]
MNTIQDARNALEPIINVMFTVNDYLLFAIIIICICFKKESMWFQLAFRFSGISLVFFITSFMFQDQYLIDINNTPRFTMYMTMIGMLSVLLYLGYWMMEIFNLSMGDDKEVKNGENENE